MPPEPSNIQQDLDHCPTMFIRNNEIMNTRLFSFEVIINSRLPFLRLTAVPPFFYGVTFRVVKIMGIRWKRYIAWGQICGIWQKAAKKGKQQQQQQQQQQQKRKKTFFSDIKRFPGFCLFNQVIVTYWDLLCLRRFVFLNCYCQVVNNELIKKLAIIKKLLNG